MTTTTTGWEGHGLSLSAADFQFVASYRDWVEAYEAQVSDLVRNVHAVFQGDLRLEGWEHRVKTLDSLARKIATDRLPDDAPPLPQVLADTGDILRYTMIAEPARFSRLTQWAMVEFRDRGCQFISSRNGFTPNQNDYRGYNTKWRTEQGVPFEVQFHTPDSWAASITTHPWYEEIRLPGTPQLRKDELEFWRAKEYAKVPLPPDASSIIDPAEFPVAVRRWRTHSPMSPQLASSAIHRSRRPAPRRPGKDIGLG